MVGKLQLNQSFLGQIYLEKSMESLTLVWLLHGGEQWIGAIAQAVTLQREAVSALGWVSHTVENGIFKATFCACCVPLVKVDQLLWSSLSAVMLPHHQYRIHWACVLESIFLWRGPCDCLFDLICRFWSFSFLSAKHLLRTSCICCLGHPCWRV